MRWNPKIRSHYNYHIQRSGLVNSEPQSKTYVMVQPIRGEDSIYDDRTFVYDLINAPEIGDPNYKVIGYFKTGR